MHTLIVPVVLVGMFCLIVTIFLTAVILLIVHSVRSSRHGGFARSQNPIGVGSAALANLPFPAVMDPALPPLIVDDRSAANAHQSHQPFHHGHHGMDNHHGHMSAPDAGSFDGGHHSSGFDPGAGSFSSGDGGGGSHSH